MRPPMCHSSASKRFSFVVLCLYMVWTTAEEMLQMEPRQLTDAECPATCFGYTCLFLLDYEDNAGDVYTCSILESQYGCDCSGCDCCVSTDAGATDQYGDGCDEYAASPGWCGNYDDPAFSSNEMCCGCGGGVSSGVSSGCPVVSEGWTCDQYYASNPAYTCEMLEMTWGYDCSGCTCGATSPPSVSSQPTATPNPTPAPITCQTLEQLINAVANAEDGSAPINIVQDLTFTETISVYGVAVRIFSSTLAILYGGNAVGFFDVDEGGSLTLEYLTFVNGAGVINSGTWMYGGAFHVYDSSTFFMSDCSVSHSNADYGGVVTVAADSEGTFVRTRFHDNMARVSGGVFFVASGATVEIRDCVLESNLATDGGVIRINTATVKVSRSRFAYNRAIFDGGVCDGTGISFSNSSFEYNQAGADGGVLHGSADLVDCKISSNEAASGGGALYATATTTITGTDIANCHASNQGAAIYSAAAVSVRVSDSRIRNFNSSWYSLGCLNRAFGAADSNGQMCGAYSGHAEYCSIADDADFTATEMCCGCGGGVVSFGDMVSSDAHILFQEESDEDVETVFVLDTVEFDSNQQSALFSSGASYFAVRNCLGLSADDTTNAEVLSCAHSHIGDYCSPDDCTDTASSVGFECYCFPDGTKIDPDLGSCDNTGQIVVPITSYTMIASKADGFSSTIVLFSNAGDLVLPYEMHIKENPESLVWVASPVAGNLSRCEYGNITLSLSTETLESRDEIYTTTFELVSGSFAEASRRVPITVHVLVTAKPVAANSVVTLTNIEAVIVSGVLKFEVKSVDSTFLTVRDGSNIIYQATLSHETAASVLCTVASYDSDADRHLGECALPKLVAGEFFLTVLLGSRVVDGDAKSVMVTQCPETFVLDASDGDRSCTCPPGRYMLGSTCTECAAGTVKPASGLNEASCIECETEDGETSNAQRTNCTCAAGYYRDAREACLLCPAGVTCLEGSNHHLTDWQLNPGYWRSDAGSENVFKCRFGLKSCPEQLDDICMNTKYPLCACGYAGPLCSECDASDPGHPFFLSWVGSSCLSCDDGTSHVPTVVLVVLCTVAAVIFVKSFESEKLKTSRAFRRFQRLYRTGSIKFGIIVFTCQVR